MYQICNKILRHTVCHRKKLARNKDKRMKAFYTILDRNSKRISFIHFFSTASKVVEIVSFLFFLLDRIHTLSLLFISYKATILRITLPSIRTLPFVYINSKALYHLLFNLEHCMCSQTCDEIDGGRSQQCTTLCGSPAAKTDTDAATDDPMEPESESGI